MQKNDWFYLHLLQRCQDSDLQHRLDALEELQYDYLDLLTAQFLLDRLNSTGHWQEQKAILELMCQICRQPYEQSSRKPRRLARVRQ